MKTIIRCMLPAAGILAALPSARADDPPPPEKGEMRVLTPGTPPPHAGHHHLRAPGPQEMETVTYLGIMARPIDAEALAVLADQLNLPAGTGLVIREIAPDTPAATVLKRNDVLLRLDDQILVDPHQLAVLVRSHQEGDEVTLTFIRRGKETTAKVKLAKHEVPKMAMMDTFYSPLGTFNMPFGEAGMDREEMDRMLSLMDQGGAFPQIREFHRVAPMPAQPGLQNITVNTVNTSNSNMVFTDDQGSLDLTIKDGKKNLVAKNAKGEQVFSGPVTTPDERKAMPSEVRERLDKLEGMQDFTFRTDDDFQGGQLKVVRPGKTKIQLNRPKSGAPSDHGAGPF